jgi:hypothetical protein
MVDNPRVVFHFVDDASDADSKRNQAFIYNGANILFGEETRIPTETKSNVLDERLTLANTTFQLVSFKPSEKKT